MCASVRYLYEGVAQFAELLRGWQMMPTEHLVRLMPLPTTLEILASSLFLFRLTLSGGWIPAAQAEVNPVSGRL